MGEGPRLRFPARPLAPPSLHQEGWPQDCGGSILQWVPGEGRDLVCSGVRTVQWLCLGPLCMLLNS